MQQKDCSSFFRSEQQGDVLFVTPIHNLGDLDLLAVNSTCEAIVDGFVQSGCRHVVLDLSQIQMFGSTAIGLFLKLWSRVRDADGCMLVCNASPHERSVLQHTRLDTLWPIVATREAALDHIRQAKASPPNSSSPD